MLSGERPKAQQGFVYIGLLIGLAIIGIGLSATSVVWTQTRQREKEEELLFVGNQIRQAISRFYIRTPTGVRRFPMSLEELVNDTRAPDKPGHFLRRVYNDPMTGTPTWGEIRLASGQLVGVYSLSNETPFKVFGFAVRDKDLADKEHYSEWIFRSPLPAANPVLAAGGGYSAPPSPPLGTPPPGTPRTQHQNLPPTLGLPNPRTR